MDYYDPSVYNDCPNKKALYQVGEYKKVKGKPGSDAHHVGQKALMKRLVKNYDFKTAPAINVPNKKLKELIDLNKLKYPEMRK